jgi:hypothetical protein
LRIIGESFPSHEKKDLEKKEVDEHLLASAVMNMNDDDKDVHNGLNADHECAPISQEESGGPAQALDSSFSEFPSETEYIDQVRSACPLLRCLNLTHLPFLSATGAAALSSRASIGWIRAVGARYPELHSSSCDAARAFPGSTVDNVCARMGRANVRH